MTRKQNNLLDHAINAGGDLALFAIFEVDLSLATVGGGWPFPLTPSLKGKHTPLWSLEGAGPTHAQLEREAHEASKLAHQKRVADYTKRVEEGVPLFDDGDDPEIERVEEIDPSQGWDKFWMGASPTERGRVPHQWNHVNPTFVADDPAPRWDGGQAGQ